MAPPLDRILPVARRLLTLPDGETRSESWLCEHSERVMRAARMIAKLPEVAAREPDVTAVQVAGLFHDAGWAVQVRQGRLDRWQILSRPTNDIQRELGASLLKDEVAHMLPAETARRAIEAVRQCNDRHSDLIEAQVLAEAENLDDIGVMYLLRQFRQYQAEGRPLEQLLASWQRQHEYRFWEARVADSFRFDLTRDLARARLKAVAQFMGVLGIEQTAGDLEAVLLEAGVEVTSV
ncbi:MAG: HD domain-containing protein [Planctomycetes bacterium]|nr:HD domain-containing protein [Planctomycetota bacterium]